jgi:hypothetical protein
LRLHLLNDVVALPRPLPFLSLITSFLTGYRRPTAERGASSLLEKGRADRERQLRRFQWSSNQSQDFNSQRRIQEQGEIVRGEHDDRTMLKSDRIALRHGTLQRVGFTADRLQLVAGIGSQAAKIQFRVVADPAQRYAV